MQDKVKKAVTAENRVMGYRLSDLLGIIIMIIPFIISISFEQINPARSLLWIKIGKETITSIRPDLISTLCSVVFYASLIVRYEGIFKSNNLFEAFISTIRAFLNCWVFAALVKVVLQNDTKVTEGSFTLFALLRNPETTMLVFAILLSWLGMKSIAGFSWILFIVAAMKNLLVVNSAMGMLGAVFVLTITISLFLQIRDYSNIRDFMRDFRGGTSKYRETVRQDINAAKDDTVVLVENTVAAVTGSVNPVAQSDHAKIDLDALDVNKDGVVDMKDFRLIFQEKDDKG